MPFQRTRARLVLTAEVESRLSTLAHSRTASAQQVERAQILLAYAAGESISAIARHRSREFVDFLQRVDRFYPASATIRIILDNHSAHLSKETRAYLATVPNRFDFVFTPKHGSWLNLVESFFAKLTKTLLRGIRGASKAELRERIERHLQELNQEPVVMKWTYGLESLSVA